MENRTHGCRSHWMESSQDHWSSGSGLGDGGPFNLCGSWQRALHGAEWPEKGFVVPHRRARIARGSVSETSRWGEVSLTGREQLRPQPERILERICDQSGVIEVTKISSKDQTLQRPGDQILEGFAQDRLQQRSFEQNIVPEMIEHLEEVPKMMSQNGTAGQIVDLPAPVFRDRISERICV